MKKKLSKYIVKIRVTDEKFIIMSAKSDKEIKEWYDAYTDTDVQDIEVYECDGMGYSLKDSQSKSEEIKPIGFLR